MTPDPIVDEIHRIRDAHAAKFNFDLRAIFLDLQERQSHSGREYVSFDPQPCHATEPREVTDAVQVEEVRRRLEFWKILEKSRQRAVKEGWLTTKELKASLGLE